MTEKPDFATMAEDREEEVSSLEDLQIYLMMVKNILSQDSMPLEFRVNILIESLDDIELIINAVKISLDQGLISKEVGNPSLDILKSKLSE